jgi:hypothetical protein
MTLAWHAQAAIPAGERQALIDLYDKTNGDNWSNKTGWKGAAGTECTWFGVTCNGAGDTVLAVNLASNNLTGPLPALPLPSLALLRLDSNHLTGPLPDFPAGSQLETLLVRSNALVGEIPRSFLNLTRLAALSLDYNGLSANDPAVRALVDARNPEWATTQTVAPTGILTRPDNRSTVTVSWTINPYLSTSHFEVASSAGPTQSVPFGENNAIFSGLDSTKSYDFRVRMITEPNESNANRIESQFSSPIQGSPGPEPRTFEIGVPKTYTLWVDPVNGSDSNNGKTRLTAYKTINAAWSGAINRSAGIGVEIVLRPGDYPQETFTSQIGQFGSYEFPTILRAEFPDTARLHGQLIISGNNVYVIGLSVEGRGPSFYAIQGVGDFLLLRDVHVTVGDGVYFQLSSHIYLENVRIEDSNHNGIDIDRTRYGHVINSRVARAAAACMTVTEGSAYLTIDGNDFGPSANGIEIGGFSIFERLISPWIRYDTYDVKVTNNVIHDYSVIALAFGGSYNLLFAHNTVVAPLGGTFIFGGYGRRVCGEPSTCQTLRAAGGWGPTASGLSASIPNKNVSIFNNIFDTRPSMPQAIFLNTLPAVTTQPSDSNVPVPTRSDDNLQVRGNIAWAKVLQLVPSSGAGCDDSNPTCNTAQLMADNRISTFQPQLIDPLNGNFRPVANGNLFGLAAVTIPPFTWSEMVPTGELTNTVSRDADNIPRTRFVPGAFTLSSAPTKHRAIAPR